MYESGYNKIFIGMLLIIFDINLGFINILPDFIGYIFIYAGLSILTPQNKFFEKGKMPALILVLLTIKSIIHYPNNNILLGKIHDVRLIPMIIEATVAVINLYLIYIISKGIYELCKERGLGEYEKSIESRFKFYFIVSVITIFYIPFSINLPSDFNMFMIVVLIIRLFAALFIAGAFRKGKMYLNT